jgi:hypothetical protein
VHKKVGDARDSDHLYVKGNEGKRKEAWGAPQRRARGHCSVRRAWHALIDAVSSPRPGAPPTARASAWECCRLSAGSGGRHVVGDRGRRELSAYELEEEVCTLGGGAR